MYFVHQIMIMGEVVSQRERESVRESREPEDLKEGEMETRPHAYTHTHTHTHTHTSQGDRKDRQERSLRGQRQF